MRSLEERSAADAVGQPGATARSIVFSVLISVGVVLFNVWWGRPEAIITLLLALLLAFANLKYDGYMSIEKSSVKCVGFQ